MCMKIRSKLAPKILAGIFSCLFCAAANAQWVVWPASSGGNNHLYMAVAATPGQTLTWNIANAAAIAQGGTLATITSPAENAFVFSLVNSPIFFNTFNGSGPALGGIQPPGSPEPGGGWSWATGELWSYTNWLPGSPDNAGGFINEDRLHFFSSIANTPSAMWNDINQNDTNLGGYVIEVVPEPGAAALLALGFCSFLRLARKRSS
jgi:hypothetical protein